MAHPSSSSALSLVPEPQGYGQALSRHGIGRPLAGFTQSSCSSSPSALSGAGELERRVSLISLAGGIRHLRRRWKLALICALPIALLVFAYLGLGEKVYEAEARLLLSMQDSSVLSEGGHSSASEFSAPLFVNDHREGLRARSYLAYFYDKLPRAERDAYLAPALAPKSRDWLSFLHGSTSAAPGSADPKEVFIKKLSEATRIEPLKDSHILRVLIRDSSPTVASRLANLYVQDYIEYITQQSLAGKKAESDFLRQKGEELRQRLQDSESKLSSYRQAENLVDATESREISSEQVKFLTQSLAAAQVRQAGAKQNIEAIRQATSAGRDLLQLRLVGDNPDVSSTRKLLEASEAELADMTVQRGAKHPRVLEMNQRIATLSKQLQASVEGVVSMLNSEAASVARDIEDLQKQLDKARSDLLAQGGKGVQQNLLKEQVGIDRQNYQNNELRMNQAQLAGNFKDISLFRVSDVATPPERPIKPNKPLAALAAFFMFGLVFIGLPVGVGLGEDLILPLWRAEDPRSAVSTRAACTCGGHADGPGDISITVHPVEAIDSVVARVPTPPVPVLTHGAEGASVGLVASPAEHALGFPEPCPILARLPEVPFITPPEVLSALLSSLASTDSVLGYLCGSLIHQPAPRPGPRVLLVLSAERYEGKTLLASTVAGYLAMHGCRTLLMDCHPEAPSVHRWFRLPADHSSGAHQLGELRYANSPLYVLPAHDLPSYDFSELVSGYAAWIGKAQGQVDWIVIDGPPVLRSYAEALQLLPLATDIIMVHDADRTPEAKVKASLNLLHPRIDPTLLRGIVLNRQRA